MSNTLFDIIQKPEVSRNEIARAINETQLISGMLKIGALLALSRLDENQIAAFAEIARNGIAEYVAHGIDGLREFLKRQGLPDSMTQFLADLLAKADSDHATQDDH